MERITKISISALATLLVTVALVAPASAYESINAAENTASAADRSSNPGGTSMNAIIGASTPAETGRVAVSSPNAIQGGDNVAPLFGETSTASSSTGFDWTDALVGAGGALLLVLFTGGAMVLVRRRRGPHVQPTV